MTIPDGNLVIPEPQNDIELTRDIDYVLPCDVEDTWILVDNISVHIVRHQTGLQVDLFPKDLEADDKNLLDSAWGYFGQAGRMIDADSK